jgi:hypothetical protein
MHAIRYSFGKLLGMGLVTGAFAGLWLWMLLDPKAFMHIHGRYGWLVHLIAENGWLSGALFAACFSATALLLTTALGDRLALAIGPEGIEIRTMLARHKAGWDRVGRIAIEKAGRMAGGGETLVVRLQKDASEKTVRLSTGLLEQSRWEINRLLEAAGRPGIGGEVAAPAGDAAEAAPGMDYDAVIARHLAAREQAGTAPAAPPARPAFSQPAGFPQPARGGFGRKGL